MAHKGISNHGDSGTVFSGEFDVGRLGGTLAVGTFGHAIGNQLEPHGGGAGIKGHIIISGAATGR